MACLTHESTEWGYVFQKAQLCPWREGGEKGGGVGWKDLPGFSSSWRHRPESAASQQPKHGDRNPPFSGGDTDGYPSLKQKRSPSFLDQLIDCYGLFSCGMTALTMASRGKELFVLFVCVCPRIILELPCPRAKGLTIT